MGDLNRIDQRNSVLIRGESLTITLRIMRDFIQGFTGVVLGAAVGSLLAAGSFLAVESLMPSVMPGATTAVIDRTVHG